MCKSLSVSFPVKAVVAVVLFVLCAAAPQARGQGFWMRPAKDVKTSTNGWDYIPVTKTNAQLIFDWLDDVLGIDSSAWTNLAPASNTVQDVFDWVDDNWPLDSDYVAAVTSAYPYLDRDYRNDLTSLVFSASGSTNWTFTFDPSGTSGVGEVGVPSNLVNLAESLSSSTAAVYAVAYGTSSVQKVSYPSTDVLTNYSTFVSYGVGSLSAGTLTITNPGRYVVGGLVRQRTTGVAQQNDLYLNLSDVVYPVISQSSYNPASSSEMQISLAGFVVATTNTGVSLSFYGEQGVATVTAVRVWAARVSE